jgi:hypothetical protein
MKLLRKKESKLITKPDMYRDFMADLYLQNNYFSYFQEEL